MSTKCPANSITYNTTLCACAPGYTLTTTTSNTTTIKCTLFDAPTTIVNDAGVDYYTVSFPETIFSFDSIKKFTQSQAVFLEATVVLLLTWLLFCCFVRFVKPRDGRNAWFRVRWWISRLDICFSTRHWLDDQKPVVKRKTELGGTFSIASWIVFIGLFAALLYQIISKRNIEVHNVRATNAPDLAAFVNDMEFNITTVSSMSCLNLRNLGTFVTGTPGFIDIRVTNLRDFANYTCHNSSTGPTISFKCSKCQLKHDYMLLSWQFVDLPSLPAVAVGFQFNFTAKDHANKRHVSFVSGTLNSTTISDNRPGTFRGKDANILKFNLFPRVYHNLHDLRLIQPLFHEFLPGSILQEPAQLQASLETPTDELINTTLLINYLSSYIIEIQNKSIMGPVSFLADLGGLYCFSIGIFFYFLVQCEHRIKSLRNEDSTMRNVRNRAKAERNWDKLRKYVMYRWGCKTLDGELTSTKHGSGCTGLCHPSVYGNGSQDGRRLGKRRSKNKKDTETSTDKLITSNEKPLKGEVVCSTQDKHDSVCCSSEGHIPLPPLLEFKAGSEGEMLEMKKNLQQLYDYNAILRDKFIATHSLLNSLASKSSSTESGKHEILRTQLNGS